MPTLTLPATLTQAEVPACLQALAGALARAGEGDALEADASALQHFDSAALALLLEARRAAAARGLGFSLRGLPPRLAGLAALYGVGELLAA